MDNVPCQERDRIILAFVLAVNSQNNVASALETAMDAEERGRVMETMVTGRGHCHELRNRLLLHCEKHGC
jgi:hypothetical protein